MQARQLVTSCLLHSGSSFLTCFMDMRKYLLFFLKSKRQKLFSITALTQDREWILKLCMAFLNSYGYVEMSWYKDGFSEAERVLMKRSE